MNNDIKEILNYMKQYVENKYEHDSEPMLNYKDIQCVLDYITNLQEKNKRLKEDYEKEKYLVDKYTRQLTDEYENTKNQCKLKEDYKSRIDKVIEIIKKDRKKDYDSLEKKAFYCNKTNKLLNILEGDDKE